MCGIFGYINYLVEKDRKFILDTLVNGKSPLFPHGFRSGSWLTSYLYQGSPVSSTVAMTPPV